MTIGERPTKNNIESLDLTRKTFSVFDVENRLGAPFLKDIWLKLKSFINIRFLYSGDRDEAKEIF